MYVSTSINITIMLSHNLLSHKKSASSYVKMHGAPTTKTTVWLASALIKIGIRFLQITIPPYLPMISFCQVSYFFLSVRLYTLSKFCVILIDHKYFFVGSLAGKMDGSRSFV